MNIERTDLSNKDFKAKTEGKVAGHSYFVVLTEEIDKLRKQVEELLVWARIGAHTGRTDSNWTAAEDILRRIEAGEFG